MTNSLVRRGEEPSRAVRIDGSTLVSQGEGEDTFTVQTEGEAELELEAGEGEGDNTDWVRDIREHRLDFSNWHQAATRQMEILSPGRKVGGSDSNSQTGNILFLILLRRWKGER